MPRQTLKHGVDLSGADRTQLSSSCHHSFGSGALRGAGNTKIPLLINGAWIFLILLLAAYWFTAFSPGGTGICRGWVGFNHFSLYWRIAILWVLAIGFNPALRISLKAILNRWILALSGKSWGLVFHECRISAIYQWSVINPNVRCRMGTSVIAGNFIAFSIAALITYPEVRSVLLLRSLQAEGWGRADSASRDSVAACVLAVHSWLTAIAWLTAPFAGVMASFYPRIHRLNTSLWFWFG